MSHIDVRKGIRQAELGGSGCLLYLEAFLVALISGLHTKSWWVFGGVFIGTFVLLVAPVISKIIYVTISGFWAAIVGVAVYSWGLGASVVLGGFVFMFVYATHACALEYLDDVSDRRTVG